MTSLFAWVSEPTLLIVLVIVILLFGNRLPGVMRSLGRGVTEFKKGIEGVGDDVDLAVNKTESAKKLDQESVTRVDQQSAKKVDQETARS